MINIFFTGCTHFHHENIIKLAGRPFSSVEEMDEELIKRWNAKVGNNDVVWHLGDVGWFKDSMQAARLLGRLNGHIELIQGNHDAPHINAPAYRKLEYTPRPIVLFHYPIEDWDGRWKGSIHLHCHTHAKQFRNPSIPLVELSALDKGDRQQVLPSRYPPELLCNRFNVGVDATDFAPVSIDEIMEESRK